MAAIKILKGKIFVDFNLIGSGYLRVQMNIPHLIHPVLIKRDDILQILNEAGDPIVVCKFVEHIWQVEGDGLDEEQIGNPLVVCVVDRFQLEEAKISSPFPHNHLISVRSYSWMWTLGPWQGEGVRDVTVGVECILVHLTVLGIPGTSQLSQHVKGRSPDATDVVAKNFNFSKDCGADNKEWQGKVGMQLRHQTILPPDVVLVHIDLEERLN